MSPARPRPGLRPDACSTAIRGPGIKDSRTTLGLILAVFCTITLLATKPVQATAISETTCVSNEDCNATSGSEVECGTSGFCDCVAADHVPVGDLCRHQCVTEARKIHDMDRRAKNYKNAIGEPIVNDHKILEGWYSLGQYRLMVAGTGNLEWGSCGSRYQIVMKDDSSVDWDTLDLNGVALTATVYGRPEGHGEDLEVLVRKCENAFQYYLKPPSTRLAAYCFDPMSNDSVTDEEDFLTIPVHSNDWLPASLNFREEFREGAWFDVPYVIWTCPVGNFLNSVKELNETQFISLSW